MRRIQKKISLEPMTSRLPSILPAYKDNQLYYFDETSLKARDYLYPSNYGMIPVNIAVDNIPYSCKEYSLSDCGNSSFILSFERLSKWYYKFKEYYHLLNDYGHCGVVYQSAQEYYKNESQKYPQDMVYGVDEETYIALDEELTNMGACVVITSYTEECTTQAVDDGFYKWICDNIIPTFTIPKPYQDYWKKTTLYYPDVITWIGWFEDRNAIYSTFETIEDCKKLAEPTLSEDKCHYEEGDCCECKEYVNRGGNDMYSRLTDWYDTIQTAITKINDTVSGSCYTPTIITPISMQGNLHTNGEMTVLCEEYELDVDYRTASGFGETENHSVGTIIKKDDRLMRLVSGGGYSYDEYYMETIFDENGWEDAYEMDTSATTVSGFTSSKLKPIHVTNYLVDDIGNTIYGIYEPNSGRTSYQPPMYTELEPIYQIGRVVNISRIGTDDKFFGDVISSMTFFYMTMDDAVDENTRCSGTSKGVLSAITEATIAKESGETSGLTYYDDIFCDITYYVGNIYSGTGEQLSEGVKYTERVSFTKEKVEYYLKKKDKIILPFEKKRIDAHSISYPIYIYTLKQNIERIDDNTYDTPYEDNLAEFKSEIERASTVTSGDTYLPLFLEEYKLGTAAPQSVKGDIYIDRGINAAFEKHLKLGEVTSMEALLQYGNGYFKITDK